MTPTDTVKTTLTEARKPFYVSLGVTDLAVAKAKELPAVTKTEVGKLSTQVKELPAQVKELPAQVKSLQGAVTAQVTTLSGKAKTFYADLAQRGEKVFAELRKQQPAASAVAAGKSAVQQARSATVRPKRAAKVDSPTVQSQVG
ncbi:MAG: hypothetical protein ACYDB7_13535 [Mycobacteriales bacterium]